MTAIEEVFDAILNERDYQDNKWGDLTKNPHDIGAWLTIMRVELRQAEEKEWNSEIDGHQPSLLEILQVITVGVACLQQHGVVERQH